MERIGITKRIGITGRIGVTGPYVHPSPIRLCGPAVELMLCPGLFLCVSKARFSYTFEKQGSPETKKTPHRFKTCEVSFIQFDIDLLSEKIRFGSLHIAVVDRGLSSCQSCDRYTER